MNVLRRIFTSPVFEDEIKTEQAYLLHVILWTLIFVPIPYLLFMFLKGTAYPARALVQAGVGEFVNILLLMMLQRGYVRLTAILQVSTFWLFFTATAITGSGIQGEAYLLGYGLVIAVAGILLGAGGSLLFTVLSLVSGWWMAHDPAHSLNPGFRTTPLGTWAISLVLFPVGAVLQYLAARVVKTSLRRARASEEKYRLISQVTSDYTFSTEVDRQGKMHLNWVAGAFENITGYSYEEYLANGGWRGHLYPDDLQEDDRAMDTLRSNHKAISEVRTYDKNRQIRWVRVYARPVWDDLQNKLVGIMGAVQDTTEQKQAEEALRASEAIYRQAIEVAGAVPYHQTYYSNNKVMYDFIGDGIYDITGYTAAEFTEPLWDSLVMERVLLDDLAHYSLEDAIEHVRQGDYPIWKCEHRLRARDGSIHWVFEAAVELRDAMGVSHGSIGMFQDITEQKRNEERTARRQIMLEKIIQLGKYVAEVNDLRATLDRIWHGVHDDLEFDRLAIFLYNPERNSFDSTLGTNKQGEIVEEWGQWYPISEIAYFNRVLRQPDGLYFTENYDLENEVPEDDEMYGVKEYAAVAAWAGNKPIAVICVDNLMSQRHMESEQLEALRLFGGYAGLAIENARLNTSLQNELAHRQTFINELEAKNTELEQFTYTVSHDLKSPLVTINGFLGYLEKDALSGDMERVKASVARISSASQKMDALLSDLLELSRVGRLMNPPENVPFEEIVYEALERTRGRIEANNIRVTVQEKLPTIHGDRMRLIEIVQNLLDNAAKFSAGKPDAWIKIGSQGLDEKQHHILFICDNGIGIDPQFHERIFGLFNKLNPGIEGTGIGLTLVRRIIEVHGGRIWVDSEIGKGTSFYFTLPSQKT
jgi:PAS domain S-box-containing protein